jgi:hypothetical protein
MDIFALLLLAYEHLSSTYFSTLYIHLLITSYYTSGGT